MEKQDCPRVDRVMTEVDSNPHFFELVACIPYTKPHCQKKTITSQAKLQCSISKIKILKVDKLLLISLLWYIIEKLYTHKETQKMETKRVYTV